MRLKEAWQTRGWVKLAAAVIINAVFLAFMLTCFAPVYETNDDLFLSKFVDGQLSHRTIWMPYVNIVLACLIKVLYGAFGTGFPWYSFCEYLVLFCGFTAITWVLLRRFKPAPALVMTAILLGAFSTDCYLSLNFSKPGAIGTASGMFLMLYAMRNETGRVMKLPLWLGFVLGLCGLAWRYESFGVCALMMTGGCLYVLVRIWFEHRGRSAKDVLKPMLRFLTPFVLLAASALALFAFSQWMWKRPYVRAYTEFDTARCQLVDFELPKYDRLKDVYDSIGIDENFLSMINGWDFYDTEKFTKENIDTIIAARDTEYQRKSIGECLGIFLGKCIGGFCLDRPFAGFALMLLLWLACSRRRPEDWITLLYTLGLFFIVYMAFIYIDRYLANRIDIGIFLSMALVITMLLDEDKLRSDRLLLLALLCTSLFISYRANRACCLYDSHNTIEDKSSEKAAVETLLADDEHFYFVTTWSIDHSLYSPLETPPAGYADKLVQIGGWSMHHPVIEELLESHGIENPFRDIVGREDIYIIDNNIERTMKHINTYYDPDAVAVPVEPLSEETNLKIYYIAATPHNTSAASAG